MTFLDGVVISMARFHRVDPGLIPGRGKATIAFFFIFVSVCPDLIVFLSRAEKFLEMGNEVSMGNNVSFYIGVLHGTSTGAYVDDKSKGTYDKYLHESKENAIRAFTGGVKYFYADYKLDEDRKKQLAAAYGDIEVEEYSVAAYLERFPLKTEEDIHKWVDDFNTPERSYRFGVVELVLTPEIASRCGVSLP